jgi:Tetratricopeptide repeat
VNRCDLGLAFAVLTLATAHAQSESQIRESRSLVGKLAQPTAHVTAGDAKSIENLAAELAAVRDKLTPAQQLDLAALEALLALHVGDAAGAAKVWGLPAAAEPPWTGEISYRVACAAGDAKRADEALARLADKADAETKKLIAKRRGWLTHVGKDAPSVSIEAGDDSFDTAKRGDKVLLIDFWSVLAAPTKPEIDNVVALHKEIKDNANAEMVGVNYDAESRVAKGREFAAKNGYVWPQAYESVAAGGKAAIAQEAFKAGAPPWVVLIDSYGFVRGVGDPADSGFRAALAASLAEAAGKFPAAAPQPREGRKSEVAAGGKTAGGDKTKPAGDPPSNPEARRLLQEAHAMRRTGIKSKAKELYQRVVAEFPNTKEAKEAAEWLED